MRDAAFKGNVAAIASLLHQGVDVNQCDDVGFTALHAAAVAGHLPVLKFLLRNEAVHIDVQDAAGDTPLLYATLRGHTEVVQELVKSGANLSITGQDGCHAGQLAERAGHTEIARFYRGLGLIGDLDFSTGTLMEGILRVADGASADKWQARAFLCSDKHKGLYFWAGSRVDITGVVAHVRAVGCVCACASVCRVVDGSCRLVCAASGPVLDDSQSDGVCAQRPPPVQRQGGDGPGPARAGG